MKYPKNFIYLVLQEAFAPSLKEQIQEKYQKTFPASYRHAGFITKRPTQFLYNVVIRMNKQREETFWHSKVEKNDFEKHLNLLNQILLDLILGELMLHGEIKGNEPEYAAGFHILPNWEVVLEFKTHGTEQIT